MAAGTASISGRVVAADTGRPVKRARVVVSGRDRPRTTTSDEQGRYAITGLPAASYSVSATKTGFVDSVFGQRRALQTGTPIDLADGQQLAGVDVRMTRGGVVTGRILDEDGEPLARAAVTILRQQYVRGEKQLTTAGADQTDDRGQYRVFGLPPGDYYVSAMVGGLDGPIRQLIAGALGRGAGGPGGVQVDQTPAASTGYAATYYPGVIAAGDATRVRLTASQEVAGIDFQLQLVPLATVKGVVVGSFATVMMMPDDGVGGGGRGGRGGIAGLVGQGLRAATRQDGTFTITGVTPGKYTIVARADGGAAAGGKTATQPIVVAGAEMNVVLTPMPGVQIAGTITLEASTTPVPPSLSGFRVNPAPLGPSLGGQGRPARPGESADPGQFSVTDVMPGRYVLRGTAPASWTMKTVYVDGRETPDQVIDVKSENITGINVIFTDRISRLSGTVRDGRGTGASALTVIAFPADERLWMPQSRQIVTARTDQTGAYRMNAIPPGDYLIVAVDDVEQGEWFDPAYLEQMRDKATKVTIGEGESRTHDLKITASEG